MHIMDGRPAFFDKEDKCIYFSDHIDLEKLPKYLHQIKKEQEIEKQNDEKAYRTFYYSYIIVRL